MFNIAIMPPLYWYVTPPEHQPGDHKDKGSESKLFYRPKTK